MNELNSLKPVGVLTPFGKFCCTIGNLPTSYMISLTYEEQLLWLCNYLQNTVIPAINNNAEAVAELQELYVQLKNYVDNYFTNLDVQQEINNKLDEMAENGELEEIMVSYLNEASLNSSRNYIFIGDSYNTTDTPEGGVPIVPWGSLVPNYLGISQSDYYSFGKSGAGWAKENNTFLQLLQNNEGSINKNKITDIVVLGGINDNSYDTSSIFEAIRTFANYCKNNYPNAIVTIGMISWTKSNSLRSKLRKMLQFYDNASINSNLRVISNAYTWYHNYTTYQPDGHPKSAGSQIIAYNLANYLKKGVSTPHWYLESNISSINNNLGISGYIGTLKQSLVNNFVNLQFNFITSINLSDSQLKSGILYTLGSFVNSYVFIPEDDPLPIYSGCLWAYDGTNYYSLDFTLFIANDKILFKIDSYSSTGTLTINPTIIGFPKIPIISIPLEFC